MADLPFLSELGRYGPMPLPSDRERVERVREDLESILAPLPSKLALYALIDGVVGNSPYLTNLILRDRERLPRILQAAPRAGLARVLADLEVAGREAVSVDDLMKRLRMAKAECALLIALADLGGIWALEHVTAALSALADACVRNAVLWLAREMARAGRLDLPDPDNPEKGLGIAVLAMGKHGAGELNYSSDIDLVVFYDDDIVPAAKGQAAQRLAIEITRSLVRIMEERTSDGYVFRTDLRLRPDAGATQVAVSFAAAEQYYEALGQNWERAAFIKARHIGGDPEAGKVILAMLQPFIWRRHLDYAAIEDIHSIKRQIHAHKGHGKISIEGHHVKLGRGGIREIEFFAQTQQLISGGRIPALREATTIGALRALSDADLVQTGVAEDLVESYRFLRKLEHRLQMVDDQQTHELPNTPEGVAAIARFMGWRDGDAFRTFLHDHLERVQHHYGELFEAEPPLAPGYGSLVFTGVDDDPETIQTLRRMGFAQPSVVTATIRGWHHGRLRATRTARARGLLTKIIPSLLAALGQTNDPDGAFMRFDKFLSGLPGGVQVFSLLHAEPDLLGLLAEILGLAPRFAGYLSRNPGVLEAMLDTGYQSTLPGPRRQEVLFNAAVSQAVDFEDYLDRSRRFAREQSFRIGLQVLIGNARASAAGRAYTDLAEATIRGLLAPVVEQMEERHGTVRGGGLAVVAMGKMGSRDLTATSDLDLIFIYDHDGAAASSEGRKPLHATQYYARLSQRLINALTAPTADGSFYDVDMRLRPSGNAGPIATRLEAFQRYHREDVWTWERMALTRARVVAGPPEFCETVRSAIRSALCQPVNPDQIRTDAADMRERLAQEFATDNPWDVKTVRGGLTDLDFIAQVLQLIHGPKDPSILHPTSKVVFQRLADAGLLSQGDMLQLISAARLLHNVAHVLTITVDGRFDPGSASRSLQMALARVSGSPDFATLEEALSQTQQFVTQYFNAVIGEPKRVDA